MHVGACPYRLNDAADFAAILGHGLTDAEVLQRQLVAQGNRLFSTRLQAGVVSKVSSDAIRPWLQIDYRNTDIVCGIVNKKMNHLYPSGRTTHSPTHVAQRYMLRSAAVGCVNQPITLTDAARRRSALSGTNQLDTDASQCHSRVRYRLENFSNFERFGFSVPVIPEPQEH
jgi:hypothetical protein